MQALAAAPQVAAAAGQQLVETEHLAAVLLEQPNGLARRIVSQAGGEPSALLEALQHFMRRQPTVHGSAGVQQVSYTLLYRVFLYNLYALYPRIPSDVLLNPLLLDTYTLCALPHYPQQLPRVPKALH